MYNRPKFNNDVKGQVNMPFNEKKCNIVDEGYKEDERLKRAAKK